MSEIKLKACPFCGGEVVHYYRDFQYGVTCTKCTANIRGYTSKDAATRAWNHRADGWHKWPEEKPVLDDADYVYDGNYIVTVLMGGQRTTLAAGYERTIKRGKRAERWVRNGCILSWGVLAWREMPEPWEDE